jgi:hypothetical protein
MPHIPDTHADHDRLLVAAYAAGDATGADLDQAIALVAACPECAALHHDLRAIAAAMPDLPPEARPRDFRLTPEQAAGLRPAGWRRWLAPLAGPRFSFAGPLGTGLATLGIAGLLLAGPLGAPAADLAAGGAAAGAPAGDAQPGPESIASEGPVEAPAEAPGVTAAPSVDPGLLQLPAASPATDTIAGDAGGTDGGESPAPKAMSVASASPEIGALQRDGGSPAVSHAADAGAGLAAPADGPSPDALRLVATLLLAGGLGVVAVRLVARQVA